LIQSIESVTQGGFAVLINLWSTTREVKQFSLTFSTNIPVLLSCGSVSGCTVSGSTMNFDAKPLFDAWFNANTTSGSLSTLHLPLSVPGTVHGSVTVRLQNSIGVSNPMSFSLP
jgi:hypothetical protein